MRETSVLFDRSLIRRRNRRTLAAGYTGFLLERAVEDLADRLGAVLRKFPLAVDIGTIRDDACRMLKEAGFVEEVVRLAPVVTSGRDTHAPGYVEVVGDEEALPFVAEKFDLAVSLLSLQGVNDLPGTLIQIKRLLKADGLFVGCLLGGNTLIELRNVLMQAETEIEGGISPRVAPFADIRDIGALMQRAGFALPVIDTEPLCVRYDNLFGLLRDLRGMGMTNTLAERRRTGMRLATLMRAAELYAEQFSDADGRICASFDLVWLLGWAPHESQQKPLARGSARINLSDAIKMAGEDKGGS